MEKPDISNQCKFFENVNPEKQNGYAIKIDGINIGGVKMGGSVEKAKNAYIGRVTRAKTPERGNNSFVESKITNSKSIDEARNLYVNRL